MPRKPEYEAHHFWTLFAIDQIEKNFGHTVRTDGFILQFGANNDLDTGAPETIMTLPSGILNETYVSDNLITEIVSDAAGDTQDVLIIGSTIDVDGFTNSTQIVTLDGTTPVALTTPLARVRDARTNSETPIAGNVSIQEAGGAPAGVHCIILPDEQVSLKAAYTTAKDEYFLVTNINAGVEQKGTAEVTVEYQIARNPAVFRTGFRKAMSTGSAGLNQDFFPYPIIEPNNDLRVIGISDTNNVPVSAGFFGLIMKVH